MTLTPKQAALRAGISVSLVYAWCREGRLPHARYGRRGRRGRIVLDEEALQTLLDECKRGGGEPAPPLTHIRLSGPSPS
jgi:excisionase family DNA binding protein